MIARAVSTPRGQMRVNPITDLELRQEGGQCTDSLLPSDQLEELQRAVLGLEDVADVRELELLLARPSSV